MTEEKKVQDFFEIKVVNVGIVMVDARGIDNGAKL
jgi:hypothetical protein